MAKGETRIAVGSAGGGAFRTGKHVKSQIGLRFTPEKAFAMTIGLVVGTFVLHIVGRVFAK
jgi:hypothetical protein